MPRRPLPRGPGLAGPAAASLAAHAVVLGAAAGLLGWFGGGGEVRSSVLLEFGQPQLRAPEREPEPEPRDLGGGDNPEPRIEPVPEEFPVSTFEALVSTDAASAWFEAPPRERSAKSRPAAAAAAAAAAPELAGTEPAQAEIASPQLAAPVEVAARIAEASCPAPEYPRLARRRGQEGTVWLRLRVTAAGSPAEVILEQSSGHALLDEAALAAARGWTLLPATRDGAPVDGLLRVPITFRIAAAG